jgi:uncharacterized damage-inducible protein DinB
MNTSYVRTLYAYDRWANALVLKAAEMLNPDQFRKDMGNSFGSVRDTLVHILSAERTWLGRWKGGSPSARLDSDRFPDVASLRAEWAALEGDLAGFLDSLTDERLRAPAPYTTLAGQPQSQPLWQQMTHLANHSSYHRGQITTLLRLLGAQPVGTDLIAYFREQASPSGV